MQISVIFCVFKFQKNGRIRGFHWTFKSKKCFSFRGGWLSDQGALSLYPAGGSAVIGWRSARSPCPPPLPNPKYATDTNLAVGPTSVNFSLEVKLRHCYAYGSLPYTFLSPSSLFSSAAFKCCSALFPLHGVAGALISASAFVFGVRDWPCLGTNRIHGKKCMISRQNF